VVGVVVCAGVQWQAGVPLAHVVLPVYASAAPQQVLATFRCRCRMLLCEVTVTRRRHERHIRWFAQSVAVLVQRAGEVREAVSDGTGENARCASDCLPPSAQVVVKVWRGGGRNAEW